MTDTPLKAALTHRAASSVLTLVLVLGGSTWAAGSGRPPDDLDQCLEAAARGTRVTPPSLATPASRLPGGRPALPSPDDIALQVETCMAGKRLQAARSTGRPTTATPAVLLSAIPATERAALVALYSSTNGAGWSDRTSWRNADDTDFNDPTTECTWFGVQCSTEGTHVTGVNLPANNLVGTIPAALADLGSLQLLNLSENALSGTVPAELGTVISLQELTISYAGSITGPIPASLGNLTNLRTLDLSSNQVTGSIPPELGSLSSLQTLALYSNQLSGTIPPELGSLTSLQSLFVSGNQLTGSIPPQLGGLTNLQTLYLGSNQLTGGIPPELGSLTTLQNLSLDWNQLSGTIPMNLGSLTNLQYLHLQGNQLTGPIPPELGILTNLRSLSLGSNQLTGAIPPLLGSLAQLGWLDLGGNQLTGPIPPELGSLANLRDLSLGSNQLTGAIPPELGSLTNLQDLSLGSNQLTGAIPPLLGSLVQLWRLDLGGNQLTGPIPPELGSLTNLEYLYLHFNQLTGSIPPVLGSLTNLQYLQLNSNLLTGSIPLQLGSLTNLRGLYLSSNQLTGPIAPELGSLTNLRRLYLQSNQLTGAVPGSITGLANLTPGGSDLRWNGVHSADPAVVAFLNGKQTGGDWQSTQTVPVTGLGMGAVTDSSVALTWTPIAYTGDPGGYQAFYATTSGGPWTLSGTTTDKAATGWTVTGLAPATPYFFTVTSVTGPHGNNQGTVVSDPTPEVSTSTLAGPQTLTVTRDGTGTGTVASTPAGIDCGAACSAQFPGGSPVTLAAAPITGAFDGWSGACSGLGACTVTMDGPRAVTATFNLKPSYTLTVTRDGSGSGSVTSTPAGIDCGATCAASFPAASLVTLTPAAALGSAFTGWSGACTGSGACVVSMDGSRAVVAIFTSMPDQPLTVTRSGTGTGTVTSTPAGIACGITCSASFTYGRTVTMTPAADASSTFSGWSGACTGAGACQVIMDAAQAVDARFNPDGPNPAVAGLSSPATVVQGQGFDYVVTVGNPGTQPATGVTVSVWPPIGAAVLGTVTPSQDTCAGTYPVVCTLGGLAAGAEATVTVHVTPGSGGTLPFRATVTAEADIDPTNNTFTLQTPCRAARSGSTGINTWTPLAPDGGQVFAFGVDPLDHQVVYAATLNGAFKTTDRGAHWTRVFAGSVAVVAPHPTVAGGVFLANRDRQVFRSTDGGAAWTASGTGLPTLASGSIGGSFLFWPGDASTLFFSRPDNTLFKSTDGGGTWTAMNTAEPLAGKGVFDLTVDPNDPALPLYVRTSISGIFKSTDGGTTWTAASTGLPVSSGNRINASSLALLPGTPATLLVAMSSGAVYASTDGGATWAKRSDPVMFLSTIVAGADGTTVHAIGSDSGGATPSGKQALRVSDDAGATWRILATSYNLGALAIDPAEPSFLFASMADGVYVSADAGLTWSPASSGLRAGEPDWGVAFQPGTPATWYANFGSGGIFKTTDGGVTFANVTANLVSPVNGLMAVDPNTPATVYSAGQASIRDYDPSYFDYFTRSTDAGASWSRVPSPGPTELWRLQPWGLLALPTVPTTVYAGAPGDGVFKSADGGATFVRSSTGLPDGTTSSTSLWLQDLVSVDAAGSALYVATYPGVFKSTDQAATWTSASTGLPGSTPGVRKLAVHPTDPDTLYCTTSRGGIFKTVDGGGMWTSVNTGWPLRPDGVTPYTPFTVAIDPVDPNVLYATASVDNVSKVYTSRDGGGSWWPLNGDAGLDVVTVWRLDIDPADHTHLIASARGGLFDTKLDLRRLTVTTSGTGIGTVASAPGGIACGAACFGDFAVGSLVTLTATPNANATFGGWSGACTGTGACTVTMDTAQTVGAAFDFNPAPCFTSADHATFTTGVADAFTVTATGAPIPSLASAGTMPAGVTFIDHGDGSATLGGTPEAGTGGTYLLTLSAHNGVGTDATQAFTLTVNQPPAITSADHATFAVDVPGGFTITTTGLPAPNLGLAGALPAGVTFVDNGNGTATLAGTPEAGTVANYPLTLTAHNGVGADATQAFTLTVVALETGDINGDDQTNVQDVFYLINDLFAEGPNPVGPADVNGDGQITVLDVFYLINYLFAGGPEPV